MTDIAAILALRQGLGSGMGGLAKSAGDFDPAKFKATLTEAVQASQDALDQMGRVCALQHHTRRVNIVKDTKLGSTPFEYEHLVMPMNPI